jgi:hypothetical protein
MVHRIPRGLEPEDPARPDLHIVAERVTAPRPGLCVFEHEG